MCVRSFTAASLVSTNDWEQNVHAEYGMRYTPVKMGGEGPHDLTETDCQDMGQT